MKVGLLHAGMLSYPKSMALAGFSAVWYESASPFLLYCGMLNMLGCALQVVYFESIAALQSVVW